jgi:hypothetical protein
MFAVEWLHDNRALTLGNFIFVPYGPDASLGAIGTLAHEVTHSIQYQNLGTELAFSILGVEWVQDWMYRNWGVGSSPYEWEKQYAADPGREFRNYTLEGQAQMVGDCFGGQGLYQLACRTSPYGPGR